VTLDAFGEGRGVWWRKNVGRNCRKRFPQVLLDEYAVMPDHFHGVIVINRDPVGADDTVGAIHELPLHGGDRKKTCPFARSGKAIITSGSSGMNRNWPVCVNIYGITRCNGRMTRKTRITRECQWGRGRVAGRFWKVEYVGNSDILLRSANSEEPITTDWILPGKTVGRLCLGECGSGRRGGLRWIIGWSFFRIRR